PRQYVFRNGPTCFSYVGSTASSARATTDAAAYVIIIVRTRRVIDLGLKFKFDGGAFAFIPRPIPIVTRTLPRRPHHSVQQIVCRVGNRSMQNRSDCDNR